MQKDVGEYRHEPKIALGVIAAIVVLLALLSASRQYFGTGTETDFLLHFIVDAKNFLEGRPLALFMHPPAYPILLASVYSIVDDWFTAGRLIALASSAVVLLTSYAFYRSIMGPVAGWGTIVALIACPIFIVHAMLVTTEVIFLALYCTLIWVAHRGEQRESPSLWVIAGALIALATLTRTNGITTILIAAVPLMGPGLSVWRRGLHFSAVLCGMAVVIIPWIWFAKATGSALTPSSATVTNVALTYFMPDDVGIEPWIDGFAIMQGQFGGITDVLMHDPVLVLRTYVEDMLQLPNRILRSGMLFVFPYGFLVLPALLYLFFTRQDRWVGYVAVLGLAQIAVANLILFESRFYLFLVPLFGAATACLVYRLYFQSSAWMSRAALAKFGAVLIVALLLFGVADAFRRAVMFANYPQQREFRESIPQAQRLVTEPNAIVVAGKPNVAHYVDRRYVFVPRGRSLEDLGSFVDALSGDETKPVYVYYGRDEQWRRPEYSELQNPAQVRATLPGWELAAQSSESGRWVLYRSGSRPLE